MALDELKKDDRVYETNGIKIIIDKKENKKIKGIKIEVLDTILGKMVIVEDLYKTKGSCQ
jgi:Fe-S cluster assembly iron-binding protein IscA